MGLQDSLQKIISEENVKTNEYLELFKQFIISTTNRKSLRSSSFYIFARKMLNLEKDSLEWKESKKILKRIWKQQQEDGILVRSEKNKNEFILKI